MITAVKTKRGGDMLAATESSLAATRKTKVGDRYRVNECTGADLPSGDSGSVAETPVAAGTNKNGRAKLDAQPKVVLRGRSKTKRGAGEKHCETEIRFAGSADTTNGAARFHLKPTSTMPRRSRTRGKGESQSEVHCPVARPAETNGRASILSKPDGETHGQSADGDAWNATELPVAICRQLKPLQCARVAALKMRIRVDNGIGSFVARLIGDGADKSEADRQKLRKIADELVACVWKDKPLKHPEHEAVVTANAGIIGAAGTASQAFQKQIDFYEKQMETLVKQLPIAAWLDEPEQRGIGLVSVAKIIGECETDQGSLSGYRNPSCVWKRMGCAPYQGKMPSTWRSGKEGKASAEDWVAMGYNPRRRSLMYVIGEGIVKQNGDGPYRKRYDEAKATFQEKHPDYSKGRCHSHGMLLASKLLLKNLWIQMRGE